MTCFVDTLRPITTAETAPWRAYLSLHRDHWRAARAMFHRSYNGEGGQGVMLRPLVIPPKQGERKPPPK